MLYYINEIRELDIQFATYAVEIWKYNILLKTYNQQLQI